MYLVKNNLLAELECDPGTQETNDGNKAAEICDQWQRDLMVGFQLKNSW